MQYFDLSKSHIAWILVSVIKLREAENKQVMNWNKINHNRLSFNQQTTEQNPPYKYTYTWNNLIQEDNITQLNYSLHIALN